jgi:hypothetical protein
MLLPLWVQGILNTSMWRIEKSSGRALKVGGGRRLKHETLLHEFSVIGLQTLAAAFDASKRLAATMIPGRLAASHKGMSTSPAWDLVAVRRWLQEQHIRLEGAPRACIPAPLARESQPRSHHNRAKAAFAVHRHQGNARRHTVGATMAITASASVASGSQPVAHSRRRAQRRPRLRSGGSQHLIRLAAQFVRSVEQPPETPRGSLSWPRRTMAAVSSGARRLYRARDGATRRERRSTRTARLRAPSARPRRCRRTRR